MCFTSVSTFNFKKTDYNQYCSVSCYSQWIVLLLKDCASKRFCCDRRLYVRFSLSLFVIIFSLKHFRWDLWFFSLTTTAFSAILIKSAQLFLTAQQHVQNLSSSNWKRSNYQAKSTTAAAFSTFNISVCDFVCSSTGPPLM